MNYEEIFFSNVFFKIYRYFYLDLKKIKLVNN